MEGESQRISDPWLDDHAGLFEPGMEVLELGCGAGDDCVDLARHGVKIIAFDQSMAGLRQTRQRVAGARTVRGDMRKPLPFRDETFDVVVASLSIHYFDWKTSLAIVGEVHRVLRPGGWFVCRVNRVGDIHFAYGEGREIEPEFFEVRPRHFKRFFSEDSLEQLLKSRLTVDSIVPRVSTRWGKEKQTLVARTRRPS